MASTLELTEAMWDENSSELYKNCKPITLTITANNLSTSETLYVHKCEEIEHHKKISRDEYNNLEQIDNNTIYFIPD